MDKLQQRNTNNFPTSYKRKHKKRGIRLFIAYALQVIIVLLCLLSLILIICGCLYIREHLVSALPSDDDQSYVTNGFGEVAGIGTWDDQATAPTIPRAVTVVLDAGHGGTQSGCEFDGVLEKDITLAVTLSLKEKLEESGINVVLTRADDQHVSLDERCAIANASNADLFVSIHCNSYTDDISIKGFEGYYYQDTDGKKLAELILSAAGNYPSIKTRNVKEENYQVLRETEVPAVLLEIGYLSNAAERADLQSSEYQNTLAQAIFEGISAMLT